MAQESWRRDMVISTNQSTVSEGIWTNESAPVCKPVNLSVKFVVISDMKTRNKEQRSLRNVRTSGQTFPNFTG